MKSGENGLEETVIKIDSITKNYGEVEAVREVSLSVGKGELFGLIGPNGAGKTTLFKMMLGLVRPTSGTIEVKGLDVSKVWNREVRAHTGYLPENIVFYDQLSGLETLSFYARIKRASHSEVKDLLELVGLTASSGRKVGEYSKGMKQRLGLAQALLGSPEILFLDEPTTGLDPEGIGAFYKILNDIKERDVTIILTSHILKEIQDQVDRLGIIGGGKILATGTVKDLRAALSLSPSIHVTLKDKADAVKEAAIKAGGEIDSLNQSHMVLSCDPLNKIKVLGALMNCKDDIADIELIEPSLEDVFMGYAGAGVD